MNAWGSLGRGLALVLAAASMLLPGCRGAPARPDVVLVTLDTTRADHLGAYGYARGTTPHLDRLAGEGVVYRRAWSTASWTLPAHASIFTGKHPTSHGAVFDATGGAATLGEVLPGKIYRRIKANRLGEAETTLAELLREAGYETGAFVGGPWMSPEFGLLQGYAHQDADVRTLGGRPADRLTDRAIDWLRAQPRERPVHLLVNYFDPHRPYHPPPGYDDLPHARTPMTVKDLEVFRGKPITARQRAALVDRYDGEIRFMDHHLGRLLEALRELGRWEDALVVVVADHGESFGEHNLMEHARWLYEEVLRVPLIVRFPGGRDAGRVREDPVSVVDLLPLVAREVGLALPEGVEGRPVGERELVVAESFRDALAIRILGPRFDRDLVSGIRWPWKLIVSDRGKAELYRLDRDPGERVDLADGEAERALLAELERARSGFRPPARAAAPEAVSPETRERLRELGYIE